MCYEFWREEKMRAEEEEAKKKARELLEKSRSTKPVEPKKPAPAVVEETEETIPA
jgi:hypothetical protein